ncbi:MAG: di-trans,poly-cis-decaprenylcistransferase [Gammaproteobacteria bacterium]|nr:di-trans,poly-cis-decaprenylcistransferase [Gammaproteobacteria bacterium]
MDGNGRWARARGLPRHAGHKAGVRPVRACVEQAARRGVTVLTLFAFSSENWRRPREEVSRLMALFLEALDREIDELHANQVELRFIGERERLQPALQRRLQAAEMRTRGNTGLKLVVAAAYGGQWDMLQATRAIAAKVERGELAVNHIDADCIQSHRALAGLPGVDLLIRTGGEQRISNFLLWDLAYSELYFTPRLWPAFTAEDLDAALEEFAARRRRFGRTDDQLHEAPVLRTPTGTPG